MPPRFLLVKPASGKCNLRCRYCFYTDESSLRECSDHGMMTEQTLETITRKALEDAQDQCTLGFQGGEPTLRGLPFFEKAVEFQKQYNINHVQISNAFQTNGILVDEKWAVFFKKNNFLVGLSIDGTSVVHNKNRRDTKGEGSLRRVMRAAQIMQRAKVDLNILTVVTDDTVSRTERIYDFFMEHGFFWQQYIPCLDPLGKEERWLSAVSYGEFIIRLYAKWAHDIRQGRFVNIRLFNNYIRMLNGQPPDTCSMMGRCAAQYVVEADGSVYPCDFYAMDPYYLGNLLTDSFEDVDRRLKEIRFIETSDRIDPVCGNCKYYSLCRGGCRRNRESENGRLLRTRFCESYRMFFDQTWDDIIELAVLHSPMYIK